MIDIEKIEAAYQKAKVANGTACIVINQEAFDFLTAASATWPADSAATGSREEVV